MSTATPPLTIIIPVLNEAKGIVGCVQRLAELRGHGVEIIVADGGSDDQTVALASPWVDVCLSTPRGRARQMNSAAALARGDYLLFLHGDTVLPDDFLAILQGWLQHRPAWGFFSLRLNRRSFLYRWVERGINCRSAVLRQGSGDQCLFVRRDIFEQEQGYADIPLMEDIELSNRLKKKYPPRRERSAVCTDSRRWQDHGVLRTVLFMWTLRLLYWLGVSPRQLVSHYYPGFYQDELVYPAAKLVQFAKAPVLGAVKTRMETALSAEQCLALHKCLVSYSCRHWGDAALASHELCLSQDSAAFDHLLHNSSKSLQVGTTLGQRMFHAARSALDEYAAVVIVGSDCPFITKWYVWKCLALLMARYDAVLGPADDGGYVLLALSKVDGRLFEGVEWGTERVFAQTIERLEQLGYRYACLPSLPDIDHPQDLRHLRARPGGEFAQWADSGLWTP